MPASSSSACVTASSEPGLPKAAPSGVLRDERPPWADVQLAQLTQCEQPEPQAPPCSAAGASAPSSTVNEWPQPQEAWAFGLSILNPDSSSPERKSIVAPLR